MLFVSTRVAHAARQHSSTCGHPLLASACAGAAASGSRPANNLMNLRGMLLDERGGHGVARGDRFPGRPCAASRTLQLSPARLAGRSLPPYRTSSAPEMT